MDSITIIETNEDEYGYVYCLSNPSFKEDIYKIGFTRQNPLVRAEKLFKSDIPTQFTVEFAKRVRNPEAKEEIIHHLLDDYKCRIEKKKTYFKCDKSLILKIFETIRGPWYEIPDICVIK